MLRSDDLRSAASGAMDATPAPLFSVTPGRRFFECFWRAGRTASRIAGVITPLSRENSSAAPTQSTLRISWPPKIIWSKRARSSSLKSESSVTSPDVGMTPALRASAPVTAQVATLPHAPTIQTPTLRSMLPLFAVSVP